MRSTPPVFKLFIVAIIICALAILAPALWVSDWGRIPELVFFLTLGALAGSRSLRLRLGKGSKRCSKLSIGFPITYSAILIFGPAGGALVGLANGLSACIYPARQPIYQAAFNLVNSGLSAYVCGLVFLALGGKTGQFSLSFALSAAMSIVAYYFFTTILLATAVALSTCSHVRRIWRIWRDGLPWSAPGLVFGAILAVLATALYEVLGHDTPLLSIPVLALI